MTPEERDRVIFNAGFGACVGYGDNHHHFRGEQADSVFAAAMKRLGFDQHTAQPVDWPTSPGWWWMEYIWKDKLTTPRLVRITESNFDRVNWDDCYLSRSMCEKRQARFLPAHIPTFPPREGK